MDRQPLSPPDVAQSLYLMRQRCERRSLDIAKVFEHQRIAAKNQRIAAENLAMANNTFARVRATQEPLRRQYTKRQVKPLSQDGLLKPRDANRSIVVRKAKEAAAQENRLRKQCEELNGEELQPMPTKESEASIEAARAARENGEVFYFDSGPVG